MRRGAGGFIATRDDPRYAHEYPTLLLSISETVAGEHGFGIALFEQTSYGSREEGNDWTGNSVYLWAVANAAYMALMGPEGFAELGRLIIARSHYAARRLGEIDGVRDRLPRRLLQGVRRRLRRHREDRRRGQRAPSPTRHLRGQGPVPDFPELGQSALFCVTEMHTQADLDRLVDSVAEVVA